MSWLLMNNEAFHTALLLKATLTSDWLNIRIFNVGQRSLAFLSFLCLRQGSIVLSELLKPSIPPFNHLVFVTHMMFFLVVERVRRVLQDYLLQ